jgi:glycosyltransferase involved in cell wall biosynthesis
MADNLFAIGSGWFPDSKGGAESVFHGLVLGLPDEGFAVRGIVPGRDNLGLRTAGMMQAFDPGLPLHRRGLAVRRAARRALRGPGPDLIASHFALYALPLLDRIVRHPFVVHFHGPWAQESAVEGASGGASFAKLVIERAVYGRADRVIVLSKAFGTLLHRRYGVPEHRIRLIPGAVDCDRLDVSASREQARRALGWEADRPIVFAVRRLVRRMGLDQSINAMAICRNATNPAGRDAVLHIAGTGPARGALEAQVGALGLQDAVRFDGFVPDEMLPMAYRAADVTLVPTAQLEGFGLVAIESLAAGTPVLMTPVGGLPEVVAGLSEAAILEGTSAAAIAAGLTAFFQDPTFLPSAETCRRHARENFDRRVIIPKIAKTYREVL